MRRTVIILIAMLAGCAASWGQLKVAEPCRVKDGDIMAYRQNDLSPIVVDGDTISYAIVRVGLAEPDAVFDSKWVLKQEFVDNEYFVYFMEGVRSVTVKTRRFTPLHYKFPEPLKARSTYVMTIHRPEGAKYKGSVEILSNVPEADVYVDGVKVSDGTPFTYSGDGGVHVVELRADGYDSQSRSIDVPMGQTIRATINLFAAGSLQVDGVGYGMVPVDAASFMMGSDLNYYSSPVRKVSLRPFSAGSMAVSADLWEKVMGMADDRVRGADGRVVNVSYDEITDFIAALNARTGQEFRLPTEAEWEYMARNADRLGIADIGSTMEWCGDWFGRYSQNDTTNPRGPEEGVLRCVRGGSEYADADAAYGDVSFRWRKQPDRSSERISFRLVQDN